MTCESRIHSTFNEFRLAGMDTSVLCRRPGMYVADDEITEKKRMDEIVWRCIQTE